LSVHPNVDEAWIVSTVREFAEALDSPELVTDLVKLFRKHAPTKIDKKARSRKR
jgi:hypothetical protein